MRTVEDRLQDHQQTLTNLQAPPELESRLRSALERVPVKARTRIRVKTWFATAAAALALTVGIYQYPAFAYYGGKLFNQTELSTLSFAELARHGYGQAVNKSKTLNDGTIFTINGVIADDNAFLMYYSIERPSGSVYNDNGSFRYGMDGIKGFLTDSSSTGGGGGYNKDMTRYEGIYKFDPVSPFSRSLTLYFREYLENGELIRYQTSFQFEANKAMKSLLTADISQSVPVDRGKIHYDSLTASATSTLVKGHYEMDNGEFPRYSGDTKLYVNGSEVKFWSMKSEFSDDDNIPQFNIEFDVLPTDKIESVELVLDSFSGYQKITEPVSLATPSDLSIRLGPEKLWIRSVTRTAAGYDVVIAGKQFTSLERENLAVQAGGTAVPVASISDSRPWDLQNGNILWERTYSFNTTDKPQFLLLEGYHYIKTYDKRISIPVGK